MNNTRQIQLILQHLNDQKSKYMMELSHINLLILQRNNSFDKMNTYLKEYLHDGNLAITKVTPGLNRNIYLFVSKINEMLLQSENEIHILMTSKTQLLEKMAHITKQIDLMSTLENNLEKESHLNLEKKEQSIMDDILSTQLLRDNYE